MKILVAAPYYRCGSTLIQRCLNQCDDTTIYGELNGLFTIIDTLYKMSSQNSKDIERKRDNFKNKIDDDYSNCIPHASLKVIAGYIFQSLLNEPEAANDEMVKKSANYGCKVIGPSTSELTIAAHHGSSIIYVKRDMRDSLNSYLGQSWARLENFYTAKSKSELVTPAYFNWLREHYPNNKYIEVEYNDLGERMKDIISELGLSIDDCKLQSVLSNKINPGA